MRRTLAVTAIMAFAALGLAAPANAYTPYPPDCTVGSPKIGTMVLTCTGRPADQRWHLDLGCMGGWIDTDVLGNSVTGNGSSTASCPWGYAYDPTFVPEN